MKTLDPFEFWGHLSLPSRFGLAGGVVMVAALLAVGSWVAGRIEQAAVENYGIVAANYMESFIAPLTQDLAEGDTLSDPAARAMNEIFTSTALNERIVSYKIWKEGGLVVHASDPTLIGQRFPPSDDLLAALSGRFAASFEDLNDQEDEGEALLGVPLLEVYSPIHEIFTGRIIAVAEFYERGDALAAELVDAKRKSWLVVASVFLICGALLFGIVQAGGRTIRRQQEQLSSQLKATRHLAEQNAALHRRAISATQRATAQTEQAMKRVGSDLHDGPGQYLSMALMRLESAFAPDAGPQVRDHIRRSLDHALGEIRTISRGLALPELEELNLSELVRRAVHDHTKQTGADVALEFIGQEPAGLDYTKKLCIYRFLQEGLSNAYRHAGTADISVRIESRGESVTILIRDTGSGFDPDTALRLRPDGGQGLPGLIDRAESIGGTMTIETAKCSGTTLALTFNIKD